MGAPRVYKTLYSRAKRCIQVQNPNMFLLTHHQTLNSFTPNTPYLAHVFTELRDFCSVGSAKCKAKKLMSFKNKGTSMKI